MANFSQLVRRQSSHKIVFNRQFSQDVPERLEMRDFEVHDPTKTWHGKGTQKYPSIIKHQHSRERHEVSKPPVCLNKNKYYNLKYFVKQ